MSKVIYISFKDSSRANGEMARRMEVIADRITPNNIIANKPKVVTIDNIIYVIVNPVSSVAENGKSVFLGMPFGDDNNWWEPETAIPDGSFSIFRANQQKTEILTDVVGSRSIWYYHDNEMFIASSSQRAIVMLLGDFNFNDSVIPWVISTGSLGPYLSWDNRIKFMEPDSSLILDHNTWSLACNSRKVLFNTVDLSDGEQEGRLMSGLVNTFKSLKIDFTKWVLPLSGGYDSRGILSMFKFIELSFENLRAVTWGTKDALQQKGNDAFVAKELAEHYNVKHTYYTTNNSDEPLEELLNRFLTCGEGRIDHISGYMDGFNIWKTLFENEIEGIVRGDVTFSSKASDSVSDIRKVHGFPLCNDFANLKDMQDFGFQPQILPASFDQQANETLDVTRDRIYHQFRLPVVLAALNDLKLPYVEVINPLMSKELVYLTREMADHLRSNKELFKKVVNSISPEINYATDGANANAKLFLKSKEAVNLFSKELKSENSRSIFSLNFIEYILANLTVTEGYVHKKPALKMFILKYLPKSLRKKAKSLNTGRMVDVNVLAFRCYIISRMNQMLNEDAKWFLKN